MAEESMDFDESKDGFDEEGEKFFKDLETFTSFCIEKRISSFNQLKEKYIFEGNGLKLKNEKYKNFLDNMFMDKKDKKNYKKDKREFDFIDLKELLESKRVNQSKPVGLDFKIDNEFIQNLQKDSIDDNITKLYKINKLLLQNKKNTFYINCTIGLILEEYARKLQLEKGYKKIGVKCKYTTMKDIYKKFKISESYACKLRYIGFLVTQYQKLQNLDITIDGLYKYRKILDIVFDEKNEKYKDFQNNWI
ncbi:uncharacterized protein LOC128856515 [Anastrepha ludens]|nr:uncharacterized protein LOC128856515 [Anastrepha ludens]